MVSNAFSQITGAAALIAIDEIDSKLTKQIQSIDNLATNAIGNTGNMLLSMSATLRKDINETIGNTDKVLRENQVSMFNQLNNLVAEFNSTIENNIDKLDITATKVTQAANDLFGKKNEPNIFAYLTENYISGYTPDYTFKVKGNSFDRSKSIYILIVDKRIKPVQSNYQELIFKIDSADIKTIDSKRNYCEAKIVFLWEKGLFKKDITKEEPFIIPVTPLIIGKATAYYEQLLPEIKYSDYISYKCDCSTGSSNWNGDREKSSTAFNILPTGGRKIDPNSVVEVSWSQRHGGGKHFEFTTEQQIKGKITCNSDGKPKGGGGFSSLTFKYKEFETIYNLHKKSIDNKVISSVNSTIFELPDPVENKRPNLNYVLIQAYDGKEFVISPSESNKYFKLTVNPVTDDIIVSWKK